MVATSAASSGYERLPEAATRDPVRLVYDFSGE